MHLTGKLVWKFETQKPIVANALIKNDTVYIGSADGNFRAINLKDGKLKWDFDSVKGFVVTKPLFYPRQNLFWNMGNRILCIEC